MTGRHLLKCGTVVADLDVAVVTQGADRVLVVRGAVVVVTEDDALELVPVHEHDLHHQRDVVAVAATIKELLAGPSHVLGRILVR